MFSIDDTLGEFYDKHEKILSNDYKNNLFENFSKSSNINYLDFLETQKKEYTGYLDTISQFIDEILNKDEIKNDPIIMGETFTQNEINTISIIDMDFIEDEISSTSLGTMWEVYRKRLIDKYEIEHSSDVLENHARLEVFIKYFYTVQFDIEKFCNNAIEFLNTEIQREKIKSITPEPTEPTENDYSETVQLERMIILEKLGIIKYIQSLQNDKENEKHTAEILSSFTGIVAGTIAKNLGVMGLKENDKDKNSPYKNPKNLVLANKKLDKFNIDLTKIIK